MKVEGPAAASLVSGLVLAASLVFAPGSLPDLPLCPLLAWTGIPCALCGMTRAFCAVSHGDPAQAWELNPFVVVFYPLALFLLLRPLLRRVAPAAEARLLRPAFLRTAAIGLAIALGLFALWRVVDSLEHRAA